MSAVLACLVLLWAPGWALGAVLRVPRGTRAVIAPALTAGLVGVGTVLVPAVGSGWGPASALVLLAAALLVALGLRGRPPRGARGPSAPAPAPAPAPASAAPAPAPVASLALAGSGVLLAGGFLTAVAVRGGFRLGAVNQLWDAVWHANLVTWIARTGSSDPRATGELLGAGWRDVDTYYPDGMHALAALVVQVTGAAPVVALNALVWCVFAVLLPVAVAVTTWALGAPDGPTAPTSPIARGAPSTIARGAPSSIARGAGAGAAAVFVVLPTVLAVDHWWRPAWPTALSYVLAALALTALVRCTRDVHAGLLGRRAGAAAVLLAAAGTAAVHPAGLVALGLLAGSWTTARAVARGGRWRWAAPAAAAAALAVTGVVIDAASRRSAGLADLFAYDYRTFDTPAAALGQVARITLPVTPALGYDVPPQGPQWWAAGALLVALVVVLVRPGARWLGGATVFVVVAAVSTMTPMTPLLRLYTGFFYNEPHRTTALLVLLGAVVVGLGVQRGWAWCAPSRARSAVGAVLALAVLAGAGTTAVHRDGPRFAAAHTERVVGPDERRVMTALAALRAGTRGRVLNDPVDGSAWMYALTGVVPLFVHYNAGSVPAPAQLLLDRLDRLDTDPAVQRAVVDLGICWVYRSSGVVAATREPAAGFADLDDVAALELVARSGGASAYRVRSPGADCGG